MLDIGIYYFSVIVKNYNTYNCQIYFKHLCVLASIKLIFTVTIFKSRHASYFLAKE